MNDPVEESNLNYIYYAFKKYDTQKSDWASPLIRALQPLASVVNDVQQTFKPYTSKKNVLMDITQPIRGVGNLVLGFVQSLITPVLFFICTVIDLFASGSFRNFSSHTKENLINSILFVIHGLSHLVKGAIQIITTPLTWALRIPLRGIITRITQALGINEYDSKHPTSEILTELHGYLVASACFKHFNSEESLEQNTTFKTKLMFVMHTLYFALVNIDEQGRGNKPDMLQAIDLMRQKNSNLTDGVYERGFLKNRLERIRTIVDKYMHDNVEAHFSSPPHGLYEFNIIYPVLTLCKRPVFYSERDAAIAYKAMKILLTLSHPYKAIEKMLNNERTLAKESFFTSSIASKSLRGQLARVCEPYTIVKNCFFSGGQSAENIADIVMEYAAMVVVPDLELEMKSQDNGP